MKKKFNQAVFLDRDGTLLTERGYLRDVKDMQFYPFVFRALKRLADHGFKLVVLTNQSGLARGYFTLKDFNKITSKFSQQLKKQGAPIAKVYFCPHHPEAGCACRKPKTLLAERAARDLKLNLKKSYLVGDQMGDMKLAKKIGARGILVLTGAGFSQRKKVSSWAEKISKNMDTASRWILKEERKNGSI